MVTQDVLNELRKSLTEEQVINIMRRLGASEFRDNGAHLSFRTICHNKDECEGNFNLAYYKESKLFRCFSECAETFDIFGMVRRRFEFENQDQYIDNIFFFVLNYSDLSFDNKLVFENQYTEIAQNYLPQQLEVKLSEYSANVLDCFNKRYCPEWLNDGISEEAMDRYNIKYSISRNKIIIPHYDVHNRLIGIRGRALNEEVAEKYGKYSPIKVEQILYTHPLGLNLYGLNQVKDSIKKNGVAIIAESEKACLQAQTFLGEDNCVVAVCGSALNRWQVLLLVNYCNVQEIILAFDREEKPDEDKYFNKLYGICEKYGQYCDFSFIYDNEILKAKESPFDRGEDVFYKLVNKRIKVK